MEIIEDKFKKIVNFCKATGIVFQNSEIYGGNANVWDYGPIGIEIKNNIKSFWWKRFVQENDNSYGIDTAILMNPVVWQASGHTSSFVDPKISCKECKMRFRADKIIENFDNTIDADNLTYIEMEQFINNNKIVCPNCKKHNWTEIKKFNLLFSTSKGVTEESSNQLYLRPETAQGQYINFKNIQRVTRARIPFGVAQIGKSFRNEITPGNFIFRTIEFEQMEFQWFCEPNTDLEYFDKYKKMAYEFLINLGINNNNLRFVEHTKLAHYAKKAVDIQYNFPFGWSELNGIHDRTDYDLTQHNKYANDKLIYYDDIKNIKYVPYIIENSIGLDRLLFAVITDAYTEEIVNNDTRIVLKLNKTIAPYKCAILPLQKQLKDKAKDIYNIIKRDIKCVYDDVGSIGKRYRRQDEIGTPYCITIDFDTLTNEDVTIRDRDTMTQQRIKIHNIIDFIKNNII